MPDRLAYSALLVRDYDEAIDWFARALGFDRSLSVHNPWNTRFAERSSSLRYGAPIAVITDADGSISADPRRCASALPGHDHARPAATNAHAEQRTTLNATPRRRAPDPRRSARPTPARSADPC